MTLPSGSGVIVLQIALLVAGVAGCPVPGGAPRITGMGRPDGESCVRQVYEGIRFPVAPPRPTLASYLYNYRPGHQKIAF